MVIDTSALLAILLNEPERRRFNELIAASGKRLLSAASLVEAGMVLEVRGGEAAGRELDLFLHRARFEVVPLDADQAEIARSVHLGFDPDVEPAKLADQADGFFDAGVDIVVWSMRGPIEAGRLEPLANAFS